MKLYYCQGCRAKSQEICPEHGPADVLLDVQLLEPCLEQVDESKEHEHCPGIYELGERLVVLCSCLCHITAHEWFNITHFLLDEPVTDG